MSQIVAVQNNYLKQIKRENTLSATEDFFTHYAQIMAA